MVLEGFTEVYICFFISRILMTLLENAFTKLSITHNITDIFVCYFTLRTGQIIFKKSFSIYFYDFI